MEGGYYELVAKWDGPTNSMILIDSDRRVVMTIPADPAVTQGFGMILMGLSPTDETLQHVKQHTILEAPHLILTRLINVNHPIPLRKYQGSGNTHPSQVV